MQFIRRTIRGTACLIGITALAGLTGVSRAEASSIMPSSYVYFFTPGGATLAYQDPTFTKLTDGVIGSTDANDGLWVGFNGDRGQSGEGMILFNFASMVTITDVSINFLRSDTSIEVPPAVNVTGFADGTATPTTIFVPSNFTADNTEGFIDFTGSWTGNQFVIALGQDQTFAFVSEVQFNPTTTSGAAPEPATTGLALMGLAVAVGRSRKRLFSNRREL